MLCLQTEATVSDSSSDMLRKEVEDRGPPEAGKLSLAVWLEATHSPKQKLVTRSMYVAQTECQALGVYSEGILPRPGGTLSLGPGGRLVSRQLG